MSSPNSKVVNANRQIRSPRSPSSRLSKMTDPNKSAPAWNFGSAGSSGSSGNLFGQPKPDTSKPGSNLFGGGSNPSTTSGTSLFGNTSTAGGAPLFGGTSGTSQAPAFGSGSGSTLFGGGNKQSSQLFGQLGSQSNQPPATTASSGGFQGFATPSKPAESGATGQGQTSNLFGGATGGGSSGGLFGNLGSNASSTDTATPTSKPSLNLFAGSTTPAGPPPGTGAGGSTLFSKPATDGSSLFAKKDEPSTSQPSTQAPAGGLGNFSFGGLNKPKDAAPGTSSTQPPSMFGSTPNTGGSGSNLFGQKAASDGGGLFQNLNKTQNDGANQSSTSQQPQSEGQKAPNLFNLGGQTSAGPSTTQTSSAAPFSFPPPKSTEAQPTASTNQVTSPSTAPSGFNLFNKPTSSDAPAPSTKAPMFPTLSNLQDKSSAATTAEATTTTAPSSTARTLSSNLFAGMGKPAPPSTTEQAPNQSTNANLGASTAGPAPPAQSRLKNKSMDDIITRWASDLSKYQKEFQQQAEKVASWDRMLVDNSEKIQKLYGNTLEAERATTEVERQLTAVENDQAELAQWLDFYEKEVDSMISSTFGQDGTLSGPDQERERTYQLAAKLSERLDEMGKDLGSMIEEINDASSTLSKNNKADDPLSQVVRVLNGHLTQLQQIDSGTAALQLKVRESQRTGQNLGSSYGLNGPNSDAADSFYRSYMGRR
ncbi:FG-nucleoporin nsp1 [Lecanora helva]